MLPEFIKKFFRGARAEAKETAVAVNDQITDAVTQVKNEAVDLAVEATDKVVEKAKKNVRKAAKKAKGE